MASEKPVMGAWVPPADLATYYRQLSLWAEVWQCSVCGADVRVSAIQGVGLPFRPAEFVSNGQWLCGGLEGCADKKRRLEERKGQEDDSTSTR